MEKTNKEKLQEFIDTELNGNLENLKCYYFGKILKSGDADRLPIVLTIYELLWGDKLQTGGTYSGDTMNTFATLLGSDLEKKLTTINAQENFSKLPDMTVGSINIDENLKAEIAKFNRTFLTIGNFIPLPTKDSINKYRGALSLGYHDYFDRFLLELRKCYSGENYDISLFSRFKKNNNYFSQFGEGTVGFYNFCKTFFLEDYLDKSKNNNVINFFKINRHWVEGKVLREEEYISDIVHYIKTATDIIEKRSKKVVDALKEKIEKENCK